MSIDTYVPISLKNVLWEKDFLYLRLPSKIVRRLWKLVTDYSKVDDTKVAESNQ